MNRDRGGSLDIHDDSGQLALKRRNIYEQFKQLARYEGEDTKVVAKMERYYLKKMQKAKVLDLKLIVVSCVILL